MPINSTNECKLKNNLMVVLMEGSKQLKVTDTLISGITDITEITNNGTRLQI